MDNTKFVDSNSYHSIASDNNGFVIQRVIMDMENLEMEHIQAQMNLM